MIGTVMELFGVARGAAGGFFSGIFARFGMYIIGGLAIAAVTYHYVEVSNAVERGATVERQANRDASDKAKEKIRLLYDIRAKRLAAKMDEQRKDDEASLQVAQYYTADLEKELDRLTKSKTCWPKEVVRGIYR